MHAILPLTLAASPPLRTAQYLPTASSWTPTGIQPDSEFGFSVATAGDVDDDGYNDVLVGAPGHDGTHSNEGRVYLYRGSADGPSTSPDWQWSPGATGARLGECVASAGDVNGDGYFDVIVGAPRYDNGLDLDAGAAFLFLGSADGLPDVASVTYLGKNDDHYLGQAVATAGDVNADGYADVLIGSPGERNNLSQIRGAFRVDHGGPAGPDGVANLDLTGPTHSSLGASLTGAGDLNRDGYADVAIGNPRADGGFADAGHVRIHLGSALGVTAVVETTLVGSTAGELFGASVAGIGDMDGDGYADLLVGAPHRSVPDTLKGAAHRYLGGPHGVRLFGTFSYVENSRLGFSVATAGDLDGDGLADLLIGLPGTAGAGGVAGIVGVALEIPGEGIDDALLQAPPGAVDFGFVVATGGDIDGDGYAEVLVGDPLAPGGGMVHLYLGHPEPPRVVSDERLGTTVGNASGTSVALLQWTSPEYGSQNSVVYGAPRADHEMAGADAGLLQLHAWESDDPRSGGTIHGDASGEQFGAVVAEIGDVDRDGVLDIAVSSPGAEVPGLGAAGKVTIFRFENFDPFVIQTLLADQAGSGFGRAIAGRGDFNGDGYHDFLVSAPDWSSANLSRCGKTWLYVGGELGLTLVWTTLGTAAEQGLGASLAWIGDLDGDGFSDFAIGSVSPLPGGPSGRVDVHYGGAVIPPLNSAPAWSLSPAGVPSFGSVVAGIGDVDGDGVSDMAVGAPLHGGVGRVFVYAGQRGRARPSAPLWTKLGTQSGGQFGFSISGGGDLTGDGRADLAIGEPGWDGVTPDAGRVHVFAGADPFVSGTPVLIAGPYSGDLRLGAALSNFSDLDRDGFADVAMGVPGDTLVGSTSGVRLIFGGGRGARHEMRVAESVPSTTDHPRPGLVASPSEFRSKMNFASAGGAGWVRAEFEVETQGVPFDGFQLQRPGGFLPTASAEEASLDTSRIVAAPTPSLAYKVRSRLLSRSPFFTRSRWITPDAHLTGEHDVRLGGVLLGVEPPAETGGSAGTHLSGAYPNPATSSVATRIGFVLAQAGMARLDVYDARGRHVRRLRTGPAVAGPGHAAWDGTDAAGAEVAAGVYFVELRTALAKDRMRVVRVP